MPLQCVECGAESDQGYLWRAFIADEEDERPEVLLYCPACAVRQFGPRRNPSRTDRRRKAKRRD